jgi:3-hydroxy acid dehydrogenase / malonic semialdehyde reductase
MEKNRFLPKLAVISGASSGFGEAIARSVASRWPECRLLLLARREDRLRKLAEEIGPLCSFEALDIRQRTAVETLPERHDFRELSIIVNNAGLAAGMDSFSHAQIDDWEAMIDTNLKGLLYLTRTLVPFLTENKSGHIVQIGSVAGRQVYPKGHVYNATKFGVRALNEGLRMDLLGSGIRVTSVDPGMAETEFSLVRFHGDEKQAKTVYRGMEPLRAQDVAEAVVWALDRPLHVNVQEIMLMPTDQASARDIWRGGP